MLICCIAVVKGMAMLPRLLLFLLLSLSIIATEILLNVKFFVEHWRMSHERCIEMRLRPAGIYIYMYMCVVQLSLSQVSYFGLWMNEWNKQTKEKTLPKVFRTDSTRLNQHWTVFFVVCISNWNVKNDLFMRHLNSSMCAMCVFMCSSTIVPLLIFWYACKRHNTSGDRVVCTKSISTERQYILVLYCMRLLYGLWCFFAIRMSMKKL